MEDAALIYATLASMLCLLLAVMCFILWMTKDKGRFLLLALFFTLMAALTIHLTGAI